MMKGTCKYGVRYKGLKHRGKITRKIVLCQLVVLARPPDVAHQDSDLPDIGLRCTPSFIILIQILLMN